MEAQENKPSLSELGKQYLVQLEQEGKPYFDAEHEEQKKFNERIKKLFDKDEMPE